MTYRLIVFVLAMTCLASCQANPKQIVQGIGGNPTPVRQNSPPIELKVPPGVAGETSPILAQQLTSSGENSEARYSPDGSRIAFISRNRGTHKHAQVYELNLAQKTERRLTFHDGDDASPTWRPDGKKLVYSSNTDESKEEHVALSGLMRTYNPSGVKPKPKSVQDSLVWGMTELYELQIGAEVERLTKSIGFDADPGVDLKQNRIVFSSARQGSPQIHLMATNGSVTRLTDDKLADRYPRFSPDGSGVAWARQDLSKSISQIMFSVANATAAKSPKALTGAAALDLYPSWHPLGEDIIFSSNRGGKVFNLYTIDRQGKCLKRLTDIAGDQLHPSFSPDGKSILFTWVRNNQTQLYKMTYRPPKDCVDPATIK